MPRPNKRKRLLRQWTVVSVVITIAAIGWAVAARRGGEKTVLPGEKVEGLTSILSQKTPSDAMPIRFRDVTDQMGIAFRHFPVERASLLAEDMGSGVACGDYDGDGFPDLYFVNFAGSVLPEAPLDTEAGKSRLYRNVAGGRFEDVTEAAGVGFVGYGMGAAWGDYDGDGDLDLYVTAFGKNVLYQNRGDGTFVDVTAAARVQDARFSTGCSWADYDRDGDLDLYVCNYVAFEFREADRSRRERQYATEQPHTLNPSAYPPQANSLFRNNGDGTFDEVAAAAGIADPTGKSLSASWVDMDNDGWLDLYVANDVSNNGVFRNRGDGTFEDVGPASLAADYRGAMGIATADFDHDLDIDILVTHWIAQENALYRNMAFDAKLGQSTEERIWFMDDADGCGLGQISLDWVGWATGFCDFDNDGRRDLWLVNGSTLERADDHSQLDAQRSAIFWNSGEQTYVEVGAKAAPRLAHPFVGRGGAQLDFDRDGLIDLVLIVHGGRPIILRNESTGNGHWLRVRLRQPDGNTFALGARVYVTAGGVTQMAEVGGSSSYLSQNELALHFGLGDHATVDLLRIVWPDGAIETHEAIEANRDIVFRRAP